MPAVNDVGEPCAREPHARFDGRALETGQVGTASRVPGRCAEKRHHYGLVGAQSPRSPLPRQRSTLHPLAVLASPARGGG
jgi:hypothetical protein